MKHRPIHENLDTSFVNLSALVRYLRRRQFVGKISVELSGYEASIFLGEANYLRAREHDQIAGRIAEGEEALQRILIRSREPGGIVNVYQEVAETEEIVERIVQKTPAPPVKIEAKSPPIQNKTQPIQNIKPAPVQIPKPNGKPQAQAATVEENPAPRQKLSLEHFQFELSNKVEEKAKQTNLSPDEWQTLLNLTSELLETIDKTLASANLDFAAALEKARAEIAVDYPFLSHDANIFQYKNGKIDMREQTTAPLFTASIIEILQRILEKLGANPKFNILYRHTLQRIRALINQRKSLYDKYSITKKLEKILGA
jgi:hypothetical protein